MKKAILLHGWSDKSEYYDSSLPSASNHQWHPWLQKQLQLHDIDAQTPEVYMGWRLEYDDWRQAFERYQPDENTMLVGHSCGGGFIVRWLTENPNVRVGKVVLVAPWLNPDNYEPDTKFFEFTINPRIVDQTQGLTIFESDNDMDTVKASVALLRDTLQDVEYKTFHNKGHFCIEDLGGNEFPELRDYLLH